MVQCTIPGTSSWYNPLVHPHGTIPWVQFHCTKHTGEYTDTIAWHNTLAHQYPGHMAPWYNTLVQYPGALVQYPGTIPWSPGTHSLVQYSGHLSPWTLPLAPSPVPTESLVQCPGTIPWYNTCRPYSVTIHCVVPTVVRRAGLPYNQNHTSTVH